MSDSTRKDFSDKFSESVKPDSEKSYAEKGKEYLTDTADKVQGKMQPSEDKSATQRVGDAFESKDGGKQETWGDTAKRYTEEAKDYAEQARDKINETLHGKK